MHRNLERHPHYQGRYIGYAKGPWMVLKRAGQWAAHPQANREYACGLTAPSLKGISKQLEGLAK